MPARFTRCSGYKRLFEERTWQDPNQNHINPSNDYFYLLILPPVPNNANYAGQPGYKDMQAWESAWYHAIVDGYGM